MGQHFVKLRKWSLLIALALPLAISVPQFPSADQGSWAKNVNCTSYNKSVPSCKSRPVKSELNHGNFSAETDFWLHSGGNGSKRQKRSPIVYQFPRESLYDQPPPIQHNFPYSNDFGPEEGSYSQPRFHSPPPRLRRPPPPPFIRRLPAARHGLPSPPRRGPPRPIPLPRPGYNPRRIPHSMPSYSYPRNAANIQDILTHFQKEDTGYPNNGYRPHPSPATRDLSAVSLGGDFSKEIDDVQKSLLKDIREFAQRPNIMYSLPTPRPLAPSTTISPPMRSSSYNYDTRLPANEDEGDDGGNEPKAKPVRDMLKDHPVPLPKPTSRFKSKQNGWAGEDSREDHPKPSSRNRYRDEAEDGYGQAHPNHASRERRPYKFGKDSDHHSGRNRLPAEEESEEAEQNVKGEVRRNRPRIKPSVEQYHRYVGGRYKSEEREEISDESEGHQNRNRNHRYGDDWKEERRYNEGPSSYSRQKINPTSPKPIVLKKPYGHYKSIPEALDQLEKPGIFPVWGSNEKIRAEHSDLISPSRIPNRNRYRRPVSNPIQEIEEDIVEIHTGSSTHYKPTPHPSLHFRDEREEREKKNHLHQLYLEYLERKLEAETLAAVAATSVPSAFKPRYHSFPPPPATTKLSPLPPPPMRMKIHIYPNENSEGHHQVTVGSERNHNYHRPTVVMPPRNVYSTPGPQYPMPPQRRYPASYSNYNQNQRMDSYALPGPMPPPKGNYATGQSNQQEGSGGQKVGPSTAIDKNKNLVLHLHVHRRQDEADSLSGASEIHTTTVKPLTYKEIYDQVQQQQQLGQRKGFSSTGDASAESANKSLSMELPLQEERIQDVLNSLLKYRER